MAFPSSPNPANLSVFEFQRIFGPESEINNPERVPTDIQNFLQSFLGYRFVFSPRSNAGKIAVTFEAVEDVSRSIKNPASFLERIVKLPKVATVEQRKGTDGQQGIEAKFIAEFLTHISEQISADVDAKVQVSFEPSANNKFGKGVFSFDALPAESENNKSGLLRKVTTSFATELYRLKNYTTNMPLEVEDLGDINFFPDPAARREFGIIRLDWLNQSAGEMFPSEPKTAMKPVNPVAIIYLPSSVAGPAESEWSAETKVQAPRKLTEDEKPTWHDYLASLSAITGYAVEVTYEADLRRNILHANERKKALVAQHEKSVAALEADLENPNIEVRQKRKSQSSLDRLLRTIDALQSDIQSTSKPSSEVLTFDAAPINTEESQVFPTLRLTTVDAIRTPRDLARFHAVAQNFGWLVSTVAWREREFITKQRNYDIRLAEWVARHPKIEEELKNYHKALAAFDAIPVAKGAKEPRLAEKRRVDQQNPNHDKPIEPKEKYLSLDEVRRRFYTSMAEYQPKLASSSVVAKPAADPTANVRQNKKLVRAQQAAEELTRNFIRYPVSSPEIFDRIRGSEDVWLNALRKDLGADIRVSAEDSSAFYLPHTDGAKLIPVLANLADRAVLRGLHIEDLTQAKMLAQAPSITFSDAAVAVSRPTDYICLLKDLSLEQLRLIIGEDRKHLKIIADHFHFDERNFKVTDDREIVFSEKALQESAGRKSAVQLHIIFEALRSAVRSNEDITEEVVKRAISQSFAAIRESQKDLLLKPVSTPGQDDHGLFVSAMRDVDSEDITHSPREIITFSERGKQVFDLVKGKNNVVIFKIRDHVGLPSITVGTNLFTLVSNKAGAKRGNGAVDDGTARLDKAHDIIVRLSNIVAERQYKRPANVDIALQFVLNKISEDRLPSEVAGAEQPNGPKKVSASLKPEGRVTPRTDNQAKYVGMLGSEEFSHVIAVGPPGTGKTLLTIDWGLGAIFDRHTHEKLILITPVRNDFGFLPGNLKEKTGPSYERMYAHIEKILGPQQTNNLIDKEVIVIRPPDNLLGLSMQNAVIYCDEAEYMTVEGMRTLVTRPEGTSKMIITGDLGQFNSDSEKALRGAPKILVPNTIRVTGNGMTEVHVRISGSDRHWMPIGSHLDVGDFEYGPRGLALKPMNGLAFALINQTPSPFYAAMGFTVNDVQRSDSVRYAQILMDAARVPRDAKFDPSGKQGLFDAQAAFVEQDAIRAKYMASRGGHVRLVS